MPYQEINRDSVIWLYERMLLIRRFEEQAAALADEGYLLEQDLEQVVSGAASHWDWVMEQSSEYLRP